VSSAQVSRSQLNPDESRITDMEGTKAMAEQGATYVDILTHYYTDVQIVGVDRDPVGTWPELRTGYSDWPRPPHDNGLGIHAGLDLSGKAIAVDVARAKELKLTWVMVSPEDKAGLQRAVSAYWEKGIMPVVKPTCLVDGDHDFVSDAKLMLEMDIPAYVQVYNAPELPEEWSTRQVDMALFASRWLAQAKALVEMDVYPGLQVNTTEHLRLVIDEAKREGLQHLFRHSWFCCHNYGRNRPARYPYDDITQKGLPVQHPEWEFAGSVEQVNRWRQQAKQPGQDISGDYDCVLGFLAYARVFEEELGFVPPTICSEGGWRYGDLSDRRYPKVDNFLHQAHHTAMFAWFRDGTLSHGGRLPAYLFAVCPWILSGAEDPAAWYDGLHGAREQTIASIAGMPHFARDGFSVEQPVPSPPTETSPAPEVSEPSEGQPGSKWRMSVERHARSDGVRAIGGSFPRPGIRLDIIDPWGNSVTVTSGSKAEHGRGGFEVPIWADATYTLRFLGEVFQVEVSHDIVMLTFSENGTGDERDGAEELSEAGSRLVTNWMNPDLARGLLQDLSRYEGLFGLERQ